MRHYNRVILIGNITHPIDLRQTPAGVSVADFSIAITERRQSGAGEWIEETTFVSVVVWGSSAQYLHRNASVGSRVLVEGKLKLDEWEKDGEKRSRMKVTSEQLIVLHTPNKEET